MSCANNILSKFLSITDVGIIILDEKLNILLWNSFVANVTGICNEAAMGKGIYEILPSLNKNYFRKSIDIVLNNGHKMFFSAALHRKLISDHRELNTKIGRVEIADKSFIMLELIDVTNQFVRVKQLKKYIKELYLLNKELKEKEKIIKKMAYYDDLTGVANRTLFYKLAGKLLSNAKRNNSILGVMFVDVDNFKNINDTYGHKTGDHVLTEVAHMLKKCTRKSDVVCRFGGDEFLVLLSDLKDYDNFEIIASRILNEKNKILGCDGEKIDLSISIGASFYPNDGDNINDLIEKADKAMYRIKNTRKSAK